MVMSPESRRLFEKLMSKGLLDSPDISINMPTVSNQRQPQDFATYLLTHTSGDKKTANLFSKSLASREGAETEEKSILGKLFDVLSIPNYMMANIGDAIAQGTTDDNKGGPDSLLDNLGQEAKGIGKALAGTSVRMFDTFDPITNVVETIPFGGVGDKVSGWLDKTQESLAPKQHFKDVLENRFGFDPSWKTAVGGLALDIFSDPTTYIGVGALGKGKKAAEAADILDAKAAVPDGGLVDTFQKTRATEAGLLRPQNPGNLLAGGSVAEAGIKSHVGDFPFQNLPNVRRQQVGTPLMDAAQESQQFQPLTRALKRRMAKAEETGRTPGQEISDNILARQVDEGKIDIPNPTRDVAQKWERANKDWQRAMMRAGQVTDTTSKFSVQSANNIAAKIAKGEIPSTIPKVAEATGETAQKARTVADDYIDTLMGPKRVNGKFAKRSKIVEVSPIQQVSLFNKILQDIGPASFDEAQAALRSAENQMIALGVQPVWHNGMRVRLSDVIESTKSQFVGKEADLLDNFKMTNMKKMDPIVRSAIQGLSAHRSMNMADILSHASQYAAKAEKNIADNVLKTGGAYQAGQKEIINAATDFGVKMGMTNKEANALRQMIKDVVEVDKLPVENWIMHANKALVEAVDAGRANPQLINEFNKKVAETLGVTGANLGTKISGSKVADAVMTRVATWWGKGDLQKEAHSVFVWGERNAESRAAALRSVTNKYSLDERRVAWKVAVGAGDATDERVAAVADLFKNYFEHVLRVPAEGMKMENAATKGLSVAERSMMMMEDVNRHLKDMNGTRAFQFTKKAVERDFWQNKRNYSAPGDWMKSWDRWNPDDPVNFLYDIDLAMERATKEYAYLDDFVDKFGSLTKSATHNFEMSIPRIKGFYVPEELGRQMMRVMDDVHKGMWKPNSPFSRFYGKALRVWKTGVTIYLPSHHIRNGIGDMYLMWMAGHNDPRAFIWAKRVMGSQRTRYKEAVKSGDLNSLAQFTDPNAMKWANTRLGDVIINKAGTQLTADQLYVAAYQRGLLLDANRLEDIFGESAIKFKPLRGHVHDAATSAAEYREHYIRLSHFISAVNKGLGKGKKIDNIFDEAAYEVRKWHPDGRDLTYFEQKYIRNIVPFYSWIRKSTPLLVESLLTRPAKTMAYPRGMVALQQSLGIDATMQDPFPNDQLFPEWVRGYGIGPIGDPSSDNSFARWWGLLGRNSIGLDGSPEGYTVVNPSNPFIDSAQQFLGFGPSDTGRGIIDSLTPFLKVPYELGTNADFTGAPITQDAGGEGVLTYLMKQIPFIAPVQRVTNMGEEPRKGVEGPHNTEALLNMLTAMGVHGTGPYQKSAEFEARDRAKRLRQKQ